MFSLYVCVLVCNFQFCYNNLYDQKQKYGDTTNEEERTLILAPDPNVTMSTGVSPKDIINITLLENQMIKGRLEFGKIKTGSEDKPSGSSLHNENRSVFLVLNNS